MAQAWEVVEYGGKKYFRCYHCWTDFVLGNGWHNAFYCCQRCADKHNECYECGGNRNWCGCREKYQ